MIADGTVENVFGPVGLAEQVTDSSQTSQFAGADALGTIRLITDDSGTVVGMGNYSPWGVPDSVTLWLILHHQLTAKVHQPFSPKMHQRFTGKVHHANARGS